MHLKACDGFSLEIFDWATKKNSSYNNNCVRSCLVPALALATYALQFLTMVVMVMVMVMVTATTPPQLPPHDPLDCRQTHLCARAGSCCIPCTSVSVCPSICLSVSPPSLSLPRLLSCCVHFTVLSLVFTLTFVPGWLPGLSSFFLLPCRVRCFILSWFGCLVVCWVLYVSSRPHNACEAYHACAWVHSVSHCN